MQQNSSEIASGNTLDDASKDTIEQLVIEELDLLSVFLNEKNVSVIFSDASSDSTILDLLVQACVELAQISLEKV